VAAEVEVTGALVLSVGTVAALVDASAGALAFSVGVVVAFADASAGVVGAAADVVGVSPEGALSVGVAGGAGSAPAG
jgi:hypothetical protein